jgi:two-component system, NarL family, nitrate/nitrite response regulator NarL
MDNNNQEIRIVIADDHPIFRDGVNRLLESEPGFRVVGEASDGAAAVKVCAQLRPDVLLLDVSMPGNDGLQALQRLSAEVPSVRTLVLTAGLDNGALVSALQYGARGVLRKDATTALLFESIRSVKKEEYWLGSHAVGQLVDSIRRPAPETVQKKKAALRYRLTPREFEIVERVAAGESNKEIAQALSLRENTVKHHLSSIFDKLGVFSRLELAVFALNHQLTEA